MQDQQLQRPKVLVMMKGEPRCLIVEELIPNVSQYRLPFLSEISPLVIKDNELQKLSDDLVMLLTEIEIDPWDLFDPFPPSNYNDYAGLDLQNKEKSSYWPKMKIEDKNLIISHNM